MNDKYIEETFKRWFIFGESKESVDISNGEEDVLTNVSRKEAELVIDERDRIIDVLVESIGSDYQKLEKLRRKYESN